MEKLAKLLNWTRGYVAHEDPLVAACNSIALIVASNQPFYPLYLRWILNGDIWPSFFTFLSTPFFIAVPAVARRYPLLGRAMLPIVGIGNTVLCAKLFGQASGVELFLIPCVALATLSFRPCERLIGLILTGLCALVFFALNGNYGAPAYDYSSEDYASFVRLNALSVGGLTALIGLTFSSVRKTAK